MENENRLNDSLKELENVLQDLAPAPARLDCAETLYAAGRQSVLAHHRWQNVWPISTACLTVACITLAVLLVQQTDFAASDQGGKQLASQQADMPKSPGDENRDQEPDEPKTPRRHDNQEPPAQFPGDQALADRVQMHNQLLAVAWSPTDADLGADDPVEVDTVSRAEWPKMLTGQSSGERFQCLAEPVLRAPTAIQYLTTFFPAQGI